MNKLVDYIVEEVLGGKNKNMLLKIVKISIFGAGNQRVILFYRIAKNLYENGYRRFGTFFLRKIEKGYGVYISPNASIGIGLKFPHPTGIVIGGGVDIGRNCTIYQQVTLGGARLGDAQKRYYPRVGDNVVLFAGAKLVGKVSIQSNSIIGANSVVIKDVPEGCIAVGVPATIKSTN